MKKKSAERDRQKHLFLIFKSNTMTIYEIKRRTADTSPYFFTAKTMKCFGQTLRSFSVIKQADGRYKVSAPMFDRFTNRKVGQTTRFFNPITNTLDHN